MDETINEESQLGQRMKKIRKSEARYLVINGKKIPLVAKISIGRDKTNHIVIDDFMTSRHHALIQKIKNAFFITDLGSTNGTFINDEAVPEGKYVQIHKDDLVRIGRTDLKIR
ncbi:MAG: FHA domain-containing protein [Spirochaetales bacterium]|nr:FHA domain-containing protein [Spirochaetales bacterium]